MQQILIKNINKPDWSFKNIDSEQYINLRNSIHKNGQTKNIIVRHLKDESYEIIDGKIVFEILKETNVDYIWCYVYRNITDLEAKLLYLQNDFYFENNFVKIAKAVQDINKKITKLEISKHTRYNYNEICELLLLMEYDFTKFEIPKEEGNFFFF